MNISKKTKTLLCVALVGFIMLIISLAIIILELPFFKLAKTGELAVQTAPAGGKRAATWIILIVAILRYLPTFLLFYIVSTAAITVNTNTERLQGVKGYLLAIALNAGGAIIWLAVQYITLFSTGVAAQPGSALSGIVLVAMVPTLSIAAIISRSLYKRTGNIWTPAFLNAILMTTMTIANTMVAFK